MKALLREAAKEQTEEACKKRGFASCEHAACVFGSCASQSALAALWLLLWLCFAWCKIRLLRQRVAQDPAQAEEGRDLVEIHELVDIISRLPPPAGMARSGSAPPDYLTQAQCAQLEAEPVAEDGDLRSACTVCLQARAQVMMASCSHLCVCGACAAQLAPVSGSAGKVQCPMCRKSRRMVRVFQ